MEVGGATGTGKSRHQGVPALTSRGYFKTNASTLGLKPTCGLVVEQSYCSGTDELHLQNFTQWGSSCTRRRRRRRRSI